MSPTHIRGPLCPGCSAKLELACEKLQEWFYTVKRIYPDIHISCGYRGKEEQEKAFRSGSSKLHYPDSKHNQNPAEALDLFQLDSAGKGIFDPVAMARIFNEFGNKMRWGGAFRSLGDGCHFELV